VLLFRTLALPKSLCHVPVQLLRMKRTDSQLALEYFQVATNGRVEHDTTPETCGATPTWPAVEFAFGPSAPAVLLRSVVFRFEQPALEKANHILWT
jgi:hypothetical protein